MLDHHGNILSVGQKDNVRLSLFNNRVNYSQTPCNNETVPVLFQLMEPSLTRPNSFPTNRDFRSNETQSSLERLRSMFIPNSIPKKRDPYRGSRY